MDTSLCDEFRASGDTLRVYEGNHLIFSSIKDRLLPLLEYIDRFAAAHQQVVVFDKLMGNAAALLSIKAKCREVYSPLGSQLAVKTLAKYRIKYHLAEVVPYIQRDDGQEMCPMEKLSINKEPEEFYELVSHGEGLTHQSR
jgi:hypothetical protein